MSNDITALLEQADEWLRVINEDTVTRPSKAVMLTQAEELLPALASALRRVSEERDELITCDCAPELHCIEDRLMLAGHNVSLRKQVHEQRAALQRAREEQAGAVEWGFVRGISAVGKFGDVDETPKEAVQAYLASRDGGTDK